MLWFIGLINVTHSYRNVPRFRFNYMDYVTATQRTMNQNRTFIMWSQKYKMIRILRFSRSEARRLKRYFGYIGMGFLNMLYRLAQRVVSNE
jgi:hypothetical protein